MNKMINNPLIHYLITSAIEQKMLIHIAQTVPPENYENLVTKNIVWEKLRSISQDLGHKMKHERHNK